MSSMSAALKQLGSAKKIFSSLTSPTNISNVSSWRQQHGSLLPCVVIPSGAQQQRCYARLETLKDYNPLQQKFEQLCREGADRDVSSSVNVFLEREVQKEATLNTPRCQAASRANANSMRHQTEAVSCRVTSSSGVRPPYTLEGAMRPSDEARVITDSEPPYRIYHVNAAWERISGWSFAEVVGQPGFTFMHADVPDSSQLQQIRQYVALQGGIKLQSINYHRDGTPFKNWLSVSPLLGPTGQVTHLLGVMVKIGSSTGGGRGVED